eukprot:1143204-Pelagomonas_calceolata.AAC.2
MPEAFTKGSEKLTVGVRTPHSKRKGKRMGKGRKLVEKDGDDVVSQMCMGPRRTPREAKRHLKTH